MKSDVLCGSRRYKKEIRQIAVKLKAAGVVVYEPHLHEGGEDWQRLSSAYKNIL